MAFLTPKRYNIDQVPSSFYNMGVLPTPWGIYIDQSSSLCVIHSWVSFHLKMKCLESALASIFLLKSKYVKWAKQAAPKWDLKLISIFKSQSKSWFYKGLALIVSCDINLVSSVGDNTQQNTPKDIMSYCTF